MAPKMKLPRSKKGKGSSSQDSPPASPPLNRATHSVAGRLVATGRLVDFNFLEKENLFLGAALESQGWSFMLRTEMPTFPNLVREFYQNLAIEGQSVSSIVKGVRIDLNEEVVGSMLKVPSTGVTLDESVQRKERLDLIFGPGRGDGLESLDASILFPEQRLLHSIICRILVPRTGGFDRITERDLMLMTHIISRVPYNFPRLMLNVMVETLRRLRGCLPYGMLLTHIFKQSGVSFKNEESIKLNHTDRFNLKSFHRMGYYRNDGMWYKKGSQSQNVAGQSSAQPSEPSDPPPEASSSSFNLSQDQIQHIAREIYSYSSSQSHSGNSAASDASGASVASVQQSISSLMTKMEDLQNEVSDIKREMSKQMDDLKNQILSGSGSNEEIRQSLNLIQSMVQRLSISEDQSGPSMDLALQPPSDTQYNLDPQSQETVPYRWRRIRRKREDGQSSQSEDCQ